MYILQGQVLNILQDKFVARKSGDTWHTTIYQVMTAYQGQKMAMIDLQTMSATLDPPDAKLVEALASRKPVNILVTISKDQRSDTGFSARIVQVEPQAAPLALGNGTGRPAAEVAAK